MKSNIFIPEKINVGFQNRNDTYTKMLAYVIYYDQKGVLRKETSWNSWRDKDIENAIHENVPTSGFVLNKKAGGYSSGWNHRQTYVRVYDPRGFEFEIDVPNLLYILENTNSIKGKGLEGEFVYGWDGKELVLIPVESPDYVEITTFNEFVHSKLKLKGKDLKLGATYLTKDNEEWIYLGRYDKWESDYDNKDNKYTHNNGYTVYPQHAKGKAYFFKRDSSYGNGIENIKSLSKFIGVVSEECVENYAELMELLERDSSYSPIDYTKDEYVEYTKEELEKRLVKTRWKYVYIQNNKRVEIRKSDDGTYYYQIDNPNRPTWNSNRNNNEPYYLKFEFESIDKLIEELKPKYLREYLTNGKIYKEDK